VRRTGSRAQAEEWAYVLTALGILHELRDEAGAVCVAVLPEDVTAAEAALAAHDAERSRPAPRPQPEYGPSFLWLAYAALLGSFHLTTGPRDERVVWFARGSADAEAFLRGEWWRAATALTLHADYAHAIGNLVVGAFLLWALARRIGPAAAAWIALAGGVAGNALTAAAVRRGYVSVGASTAVFAALGAVALLQAVARRRMALLALGAGSALLGLLGTGQNADLFAHLFGFAAGGVLGAAAGPLARRPPRRTVWQPLLALAALAALTACWRIALRGA
ncbi:MAG: rhomboid family intramembrane serine protease, partial [Myxococcales bacterium]